MSALLHQGSQRGLTKQVRELEQTFALSTLSCDPGFGSKTGGGTPRSCGKGGNVSQVCYQIGNIPKCTYANSRY